MLSFRVIAEVNDSVLTGRVVSSAADKADFYFYVLRYGKIVYRSGWVRDCSIDYSVQSSGAYTIQGHIRNEHGNFHKVSAPVFVLLEKDRSRFSEFISLDHSEKIPELQFSIAPEPFLDFLIEVAVESKNDHSEKIGPLPCQNVFDIGNTSIAVYSSRKMARSIDDAFVIFSGVAKPDERDVLLVGLDEIRTAEELRTAVGTFTYAIFNNLTKSFEISHDYFGIGKLYYLCGTEKSFVSNSLHLLLLGIAKNNKELSLDIESLLSNFAFGNLQPFHQIFSSRMLFNDVRLLRVDEVIVVSEDRGFEIVPAPISSDISESLRAELNSEDDREVYDEMLRTALSEIVSNTTSALNHHRYDKVIVDLSGGLDSRLVFSAVTSLPELSNKVLINTRKSQIEPKDHLVACTIQQLYSNVGFDDLPVTVTANDLQNPWADHWGFYLGNYYSYSPSLMKKKYQDEVLRLVGSYGEIAARPYYSRRLRGGDLDVPSVEEFVERYFERYSGLSVTASRECIESAKRRFKDELESLPGRTALEKFEMHYLYFRNGLHFSPQLRAAYSCLEWGPLQSKTLFRMKYMFPRRGTWLQFDAIQGLNPLLAQVPYQWDYDEECRLEYFRSHVQSSASTLFENLNIRISNDISEWEASLRKKELGQVKVLHPEFVEFSRSSYERLRAVTFASLRELLVSFSCLKANLGAQLWFFLDEHFTDPQMRPQVVNFSNRIMSLYYQCSIVGKLSSGVKRVP